MRCVIRFKHKSQGLDYWHFRRLMARHLAVFARDWRWHAPMVLYQISVIRKPANYHYKFLCTIVTEK